METSMMLTSPSRNGVNNPKSRTDKADRKKALMAKRAKASRKVQAAVSQVDKQLDLVDFVNNRSDLLKSVERDTNLLILRLRRELVAANKQNVRLRLHSDRLAEKLKSKAAEVRFLKKKLGQEKN